MQEKKLQLAFLAHPVLQPVLQHDDTFLVHES